MCDAESRSERLGSLDGLRGLGALLVVVHHVALAFFPHTVLGPLQRQHAAWESWMHVFPGALAVAGRFAVEIFFVLSGFVLSVRFLGPGGRDDRELAAAAIKRCFRLGPMVVVAILMVVVPAWLGWVGSQATGDATGSTLWLKARPTWPVDFRTVARVVVLSPFSLGAVYNSPLWTIGYEVAGSYLVYGVLFLARRSPWRWAIYGVAAAWLRSESTVPFVAGLALADLHGSRPGFRTWASRGWVAAPVALAALYLGSFPIGLEEEGRRQWCAWVPWLARFRGGLLGIGAVLSVALVLGNPWLRDRLDRAPTRYLGRISYALYAMHEPVLITLGCAVYLRLSGNWGHAAAAFAAGAATIVVAVAVAELGTRWVDLPSQRLADWVARKYRGVSSFKIQG